MTHDRQQLIDTCVLLGRQSNEDQVVRTVVKRRRDVIQVNTGSSKTLTDKESTMGKLKMKDKSLEHREDGLLRMSEMLDEQFKKTQQLREYAREKMGDTPMKVTFMVQRVQTLMQLTHHLMEPYSTFSQEDIDRIIADRDEMVAEIELLINDDITPIDTTRW